MFLLIPLFWPLGGIIVGAILLPTSLIFLLMPLPINKLVGVVLLAFAL
jgi:hypothetical protein